MLPNKISSSFKTIKIIFNYVGEDIPYQCNDAGQILNIIFGQCRSDIDLNLIIFLYNGNQIDGKLSINKIISNEDLERNKMNIVILEKEEKQKPIWIQSNDIICPKCGECAKFDIME